MSTLRTWRDDHRDFCRYSRSGTTEMSGSRGDVRRCDHGKVQIAFEVPGLVPPLWRDISRWLDLFRYRRAARALEGASPPAPLDRARPTPPTPDIRPNPSDGPDFGRHYR